ncbi:hypothetical protein AMTR_s00109p00066080 [Amborella trichopoda]|uniref:Uncharacterized protein n=1 Tax=Amborella trichopoda TaxID=13333 RepID=W1NRT9_AMBTC|nr:hypothetical protein AMTR_s00109p00066080 [Amborella trichopoda]
MDVRAMASLFPICHKIFAKVIEFQRIENWDAAFVRFDQTSLFQLDLGFWIRSIKYRVIICLKGSMIISRAGFCSWNGG